MGDEKILLFDRIRELNTKFGILWKPPILWNNDKSKEQDSAIDSANDDK